MSSTDESTFNNSKSILKFKDNFWGEGDAGFQSMVNNISSSIDMSKAISDFFVARCNAEEEYSTTLSKTARDFALKSDSNTVRTCMEKIVGGTDTIARIHQRLSAKIREEIETPFNEFRESQRKLKKTAETEYEKYSKNVEKETIQVHKAAALYIQKCREMIAANEKINIGASKKELEKLTDKALRSKLDMEKSELDYKASITRLNQHQDAYELKFIEMAELIQRGDEYRVKLMKSSLRKVMDIQTEILGNMMTKLAESMRRMIDTVDEVQDINSFVTMNRTGSEFPLRIAFQSFFANPEAVAGSASPVVMQKVKKNRARAYQSPSSRSPQASVASVSSTRPPSSSMSTSANGSTHELREKEKDKESMEMKRQLESLLEQLKVQNEQIMLFKSNSTLNSPQQQKSAFEADIDREIQNRIMSINSITTTSATPATVAAAAVAVTASSTFSKQDSTSSADIHPVESIRSNALNSPLRFKQQQHPEPTVNRFNTTITYQNPHVVEDKAEEIIGTAIPPLSNDANNEPTTTTAAAVTTIPISSSTSTSVANASAGAGGINISAKATIIRSVKPVLRQQKTQQSDQLPPPSTSIIAATTIFADNSKSSLSETVQQNSGSSVTNIDIGAGVDAGLSSSFSSSAAATVDLLSESGHSSSFLSTTNVFPPIPPPISPSPKGLTNTALPSLPGLTASNSPSLKAESSLIHSSPTLDNQLTPNTISTERLSDIAPPTLSHPILLSPISPIDIPGMLLSSVVSNAATSTSAPTTATAAPPLSSSLTTFATSSSTANSHYLISSAATSVQSAFSSGNSTPRLNERVMALSRENISGESSPQPGSPNSASSNKLISPPPPPTPFRDRAPVPTTPTSNPLNLPPLPKKIFTRRSIKMEGWLELCDDEAKSWSKKWCSLEGGYIWLFDCAEDNQKPQGQNNPRGMVTINRCNVSMGCPPFFVGVEPRPNMFTVTLSNKKPSCFSAPSEVDMCYWIEALNSKFK